ncbi:acetyl esterase [Pseudomonas sp. JUb42]|uniref:alpha/beta hydrolase n=1 Tax=Pseudomonas sp. JUb42 TaxID=2940611 RepID=UPI002167A3EC|nr:alpha/beta hydrolase [Pseudomonas sp. JUb42]MCS3469877.1 acetyl esterase [Pseudomonas sp. JUb42]
MTHHPYPLSPELTEFVRHSLTFTVTEPGISGQRDAYSRMCRAYTPPRPQGLQVEDFTLAGVKVRRYRPDDWPDNEAAPCVLYLHGGGWVVGDLDSHDFVTAALAADLGAVVIAVDYRLAPEHPFPAAFDDCLAVWRGLREQAHNLGIDPVRMAVAGDSAGGNLAAALCLALRDAGEPQPLGQALIYPGLGGAASLPSRHECFDAPLLSSAEVDEYLGLYLSEPEHWRSAYARPLLAEDFSHLAPAFIAVAQFDPLRDDGIAYEQALRTAGVRARLELGMGLIHGCLRAREAAEVDELYERLVGALRDFLW